MLEGILAALKAAVATAASSIGSSLALGFSAIAAGFLPKERQVLVDTKAKFMTEYDVQKAAGASEVDAIENAATAAYNTFCGEEGALLKDECSAVITLLKSSLLSAAGLKT